MYSATVGQYLEMNWFKCNSGMEHFECAVHEGGVGWGNAQSTHYFVVKLLTVEFIQALT
jgi:hypothetical protein